MKRINRNQKYSETPIVNFLQENSKKLKANFHALPISHMHTNNKNLARYKELFGEHYLSLESTITGRLFDSFFCPVKAIKQAQAYAADAFTANDTLFVTCGTSISNYIAVDALIDKNTHVLVDREVHQSLHFAIANKKIKFDYFYSEIFCPKTNRKYFQLNNLLEKINDAYQNNCPYDVVVLNAASYDGVICNIYKLISSIIEIHPATKFIIDEAWSASFYFHPKLYQYTAGYAAKELQGKVDIVSTQSAHKSLMALRQASLIHSFANPKITEKLYKSRFKHHSTSPSYPILASIDMARAHMQIEGKKLLEKALNNAKYIKTILKSDNVLKMMQLNQSTNLVDISHELFIEDPLKIHINIENMHLSGQEFQEYLYHNYGIYFNRFSSQSILLNIHIGITRIQIKNLIKAFHSIVNMTPTGISQVKIDDFVILYPPGVPIYAPGEKMDDQVFHEINEKLRNGINVFQISS